MRDISRRIITLILTLGIIVALAGPRRAAVAQDIPAAPKVEASEPFLAWMARASGPIGFVILAMSFYLIAVVTWMGFQYRKAVAAPETLTAELNELLGRKDYQSAFQKLESNDSFLARVLSAGVRKLPGGVPAARHAMELVNDDETMAMEHRTTYLATVGTLGPMIGLVGTVYGMILSFRVIATEGASPQASALAAGISTALFATLEGIAISIPAIYFHGLFRNRVARLSLEVEIAATELLDRFAPGVKSTHPLAASALARTSASAPKPDAAHDGNISGA